MDLPTLSRPEQLWWLLLLPLLFWLSRPVQPRAEHATAHLAQWLRARARLRRRPVRFPWWRFAALALAFGATTLAFAGPVLGEREGPVALCVLVDRSASLSGEPWAALRRELEAGLREVPVHVEVRMALCGAEPQLSRLVPGQPLPLPDHPTGVGAVDLAALAAELSTDEQAVWTLCDGLGPTPAPAVGALTVFGDGGANVAITELTVDDHWPLPDVDVALELRGYGTAARQVRLGVAGGVEKVAPREVAVRPGERVRVELALRRAAGGALRLFLVDHTDALAADDAVRLRLPEPAAPGIAVLVDDGDDGAASLVRAAAVALAHETGGRVLDDADLAKAAFLIVDGGVLPRRGGELRCLTFGTRGGDQPLQPDDLVHQPVLTDWDRSHPITRDLDLSELAVATCLRRDFLGGGDALIRAGHGPLVVVDRGARWTSVHAAFRLADSNFWRLAAFPQFLRRCFAASYGAAAEPMLAPDNLISAAESDTRRAGPAPPDRPLPAFGQPGAPLTVPLLLLALVALALRVYL